MCVHVNMCELACLGLCVCVGAHLGARGGCAHLGVHVCERVGGFPPAHVPACARVCCACVGEGVRVPSRVSGADAWALTCVRVCLLSPRVCALPSPLSAETDESSHFVIGAVLYRTLGLILPPPR